MLRLGAIFSSHLLFAVCLDHLVNLVLYMGMRGTKVLEYLGVVS